MREKLVYIFAAIGALFLAWNLYGIFMVLWGGLSAGLDNVLRPIMISGRARISALAVFVGVLGVAPSARVWRFCSLPASRSQSRKSASLS